MGDKGKLRGQIVGVSKQLRSCPQAWLESHSLVERWCAPNLIMIMRARRRDVATKMTDPRTTSTSADVFTQCSCEFEL